MVLQWAAVTSSVYRARAVPGVCDSRGPGGSRGMELSKVQAPNREPEGDEHLPVPERVGTPVCAQSAASSCMHACASWFLCLSCLLDGKSVPSRSCFLLLSFSWRVCPLLRVSGHSP